MFKTTGLSIFDDIILCGYQRKLKTMKKKYFVLYKTSHFAVARLEYFDSEKKFKSRLPPKRVIELKNCFNINRRLDTKYDYVIALSTRDGGFGIVLDSEEDMRKWLEGLINLQRFELNPTDEHQQSFDHVWQVQVQKKGLAEDKGIFGQFHVGLTSKSITFIRIGPERTPIGEIRKTNIEFLLTTIRRCGDSQCYFYMEVGRQSVTGPGELWLETEDALTAQNMHRMILSAMSSKTDSNIEPMRKRSSSANEASKPINVLQRRQHQTEYRSINSPQSLQNYVRERCDSLPSRNRFPSETSNINSTSIHNFRNTNSQRVHSFQRHSNSPPMNNGAMCSESEESSVSIEEQEESGCMFGHRFHSRSSEGVIPEENTDEIVNTENKIHEQNLRVLSQNVADNYVSMAPVKNTSSLVENNKMNLKQKLFMMEVKNSLPSVGSLNRELYKSAIEFTEFTDDRFPNSQFSEIEAQNDRPARTFSIGSKTEHNKINQRLSNVTETDNNYRVRAFSVGSRSKIPRCELQKGVLFTKNVEHTSNNNIYGPSNQHINLPCREKKSTSAPLLLNKSHNCADLMGDLMEIDFSKMEHFSHTSRSSKKPLLFKSFLYTNREEKNVAEPVERSNVDEKIFPNDYSLPQNDNGYLEMKPVGNILSNALSSFATNLNVLSGEKEWKNKNKAFELNDNEIKDNCANVTNEKITNHANEHLVESQAKNIRLLTDKLRAVNLTTSVDIETEKQNDFPKNDNFVSVTDNQNFCKTDRIVNNKLLHSASDDYCETSGYNKQYKKCGYEIQQNKSDGSMDFSKTLVLSHSLECGKHNVKCTDKAKFVNLNSIKQPVLTSSESSSKINNGKATEGSSEITPGSLNTNQELYYASLDLPPSGLESKNVQKDSTYSSPINSPAQTPTPSVNNLYAKIDFEYSDSSASNQVNA